MGEGKPPHASETELFRAAPTGEEHLEFWSRTLSKNTCYVYVIQGRPGSPIKVGKAKNIRMRMAGLQTGNPDELRLLFVLPGDGQLEWQLHKRLNRFHIRGEWFRPETNFLIFIADLAQRMVDGHNGTCIPPNWRDFAEWKRRPRGYSRLGLK